MAVANTLSYYNTATIIVFIVQPSNLACKYWTKVEVTGIVFVVQAPGMEFTQLYDNDYSSIIDIYIYETFSTLT